MKSSLLGYPARTKDNLRHEEVKILMIGEAYSRESGALMEYEGNDKDSSRCKWYEWGPNCEGLNWWSQGIYLGNSDRIMRR